MLLTKDIEEEIRQKYNWIKTQLSKGNAVWTYDEYNNLIYINDMSEVTLFVNALVVGANWDSYSIITDNELYSFTDDYRETNAIWFPSETLESFVKDMYSYQKEVQYV